MCIGLMQGSQVVMKMHGHKLEGRERGFIIIIAPINPYNVNKETWV